MHIIYVTVISVIPHFDPGIEPQFTGFFF